MATVLMGDGTLVIDNRRYGLTVLSPTLRPQTGPPPRTYTPRTAIPQGVAPPTIPRPVNVSALEMLDYINEETHPRKKAALHEFAIWMYGEAVWNDLVAHYGR